VSPLLALVARPASFLPAAPVTPGQQHRGELERSRSPASPHQYPHAIAGIKLAIVKGKLVNKIFFGGDIFPSKILVLITFFECPRSCDH
jgi:hypothetical protein